MNQKMTWEEMEKKYPNEWLLITDFEVDKYGSIKLGQVERHGKEMNDIAFPPLIEKNTAFLYTGKSTFAGLRSHAENDYRI